MSKGKFAGPDSDDFSQKKSKQYKQLKQVHADQITHLYLYRLKNDDNMHWAMKTGDLKHLQVTFKCFYTSV